MIYSKKELYSLLSDIENKVNDNIIRNTQENVGSVANENIGRNSQEEISNENIKRNMQSKTQDNIRKNINNIKKHKNIEELKKEFFKDTNVKDSYNKIKNELPVNTLFDFMDGTKVRLTHPYSFSNEKSRIIYNEENQNDRNNISQPNQQYQTQHLHNTKFKNKLNNFENIMNFDNYNNSNSEQNYINFNTNDNKNENLNNILSNFRHRNAHSSTNNKEKNIPKTPSKSNIDLSAFKNIKELKNKNKITNKNKNSIESKEIERIQQKMKEFLFETKIFLMLILFRFYNSISLKTFFVPDEYWQSIEVAHNFIFDYGYLTWEWKEKIRSFSYPLLFTIPYMILKHFNLDNTDLLIYFPRIVHVVVAALCDLYTYKLTNKYFGRNAAKWALFCSMLSWSNWNILVRTVSNSIETSLTIMALYYWPLKKTKDNNIPIKDLMIALTLAAIACFFRPTNGVVWIFLGIVLLFQYRKSLRTLINIIYHVFIV
eukprot:jgi/Orpsp1_1/1178092/evm.model.c7180000063995.1